MSDTKETAVPWRRNAIYSVVTSLSAWIMALASSCFSSVTDVDGCPERSKFFTFFRKFVNIYVQSHTLRCGSAYRLHKNVWISAPLTPPLPTKIFCSDVVQIERRAHMFTTQKILAHWERWSTVMKVRQSEYSVKCWQVPSAYHLPVPHKQRSAGTFWNNLVLSLDVTTVTTSSSYLPHYKRVVC
jgi:hypothetical protein